MLELGHIDGGRGFLRDAGALDRGDRQRVRPERTTSVVRALLAREQRDAAAGHQLRARGAPRARRSRRSSAFHFYAMAIEAAARVDAGEMHAATLLATTALGAVETLQGCEYGLEIRVALRRRAQARGLAAGARARTSAPSTTRTRSSQGDPRPAPPQALRRSVRHASLGARSTPTPRVPLLDGRQRGRSHETSEQPASASR